MTGIERHWREEDEALLEKLEREHGWANQQIYALRKKLYSEIDLVSTFWRGFGKQAMGDMGGIT